ncbi:MAG: response regulator [Spirochaetes bacterium]|jgi:two-component system nitrogen regulation response regulator NtrX|nr:response regulator [Spirochaetota bacterium]
MSATVLVVDDDAHVLESMVATLRLREIEVVSAPNAAAARRALSPDLSAVVLDFALGEERGTDFLEEVRAGYPLLPVIMVSGIASVEEALEAVNLGAADFIEKPIRAERLIVSVENAIGLHRLRTHARDEALPIAESPLMREVLQRAARAASSRSTVLLSGESGTGKDRVARLVHALSPRASGPLVKINCGALPESLVESELFGHKKGAFTGAVSDSPGKILGADGGTLFLDEIGELSLAVQVKLLRFLETGEIQRVGDHATRTVNTRLVAATNRNLTEEVKRGGFREDLFYRLNVLPIEVPPLRERREDVAPLARYFAATIATDQGWAPPEFSNAALEQLATAALPGNVRELRNVVERLLVLGEGPVIGAADVEAILGTDGVTSDGAAADGAADEDPFARAMPLPEARRELERRYLQQQLDAHGHSVKRTAEALSMIPANLSRRLSQLQIPTRGDRGQSEG